jgi:allophanate hydrolase
MDIAALQKLYREAKHTPTEVIEEIYARIEREGLRPVWISVVPKDEATARAARLQALPPDSLPLWGIPFAVKDNMDVAGMPTTAGCPAYAYTPETTATVVQKLSDAGAILIGKTNLDQFATGLVGTRSPYGVCSSVFNDAYISGGSSAGSAVAVAKGLVSFALGTDTAGSGRVPAAFNQLVGLKPTRGLLSARGVVPACRTLDCVSIFAETCADAAQVFDVACSFDAGDAYSRVKKSPGISWDANSFRFGVPQKNQLEFFGDAFSEDCFTETVKALEDLGGKRVEIDFAPFRETAELLYSGPWVAERLAAIGSFVTEHAAEMVPTVEGIIAGARRYTAVDCFHAAYRLEDLRGMVTAAWTAMDVLLLPTVPRAYTIADVQADPVRLNSNLGYYTNFLNLLDLAAVAVPSGMKPDGLPFGASVIGPAFTDASLLQIADRLHRMRAVTLGGGSRKLAQTPAMTMPAIPDGTMAIAVVGAHLTGQPLNKQLTERGGRLVASTKTQRDYRFYSLPNSTPAKPGLVYEPGFEGPGIELEVWALPIETVGSFLALIPPPLAIGNLRLDGGQLVKGFLCEPAGVVGAEEITHLGGWRNFLSRK